MRTKHWNSWNLVHGFPKAEYVDGEKVAAALENLNGVQGVIKTYNKPFNKSMHEGLDVGDFYLARWKNGTEVQRFEDAAYKSLTPADLKR